MPETSSLNIRSHSFLYVGSIDTNLWHPTSSCRDIAGINGPGVWRPLRSPVATALVGSDNATPPPSKKQFLAFKNPLGGPTCNKKLAFLLLYFQPFSHQQEEADIDFISGPKPVTNALFCMRVWMGGSGIIIH